MWLFNSLVGSVMAYGVELWGWKERSELESIKLCYMKWTLKLERSTPTYILRRETNTETLSTTWSRRALNFEIKYRKEGENELMKECWKEKYKDGLNDNYIAEREKYLNNNGWSSIEIERMRNEGM